MTREGDSWQTEGQLLQHNLKQYRSSDVKITHPSPLTLLPQENLCSGNFCLLPPVHGAALHSCITQLPEPSRATCNTSAAKSSLLRQPSSSPCPGLPSRGVNGGCFYLLSFPTVSKPQCVPC